MVILMILLVLTILSVSALSVVTLEERMARSFQFSDAVFQGAESGIARILNLARKDNADPDGQPVANPNYDEAEDVLAAASTTCNGTAALNGLDYSPSEALQILTDVAVSYLGETSSGVVGYSLDVSDGFVGHYFNVNAISTLDAANMSANHVQRVYYIWKQTGCPL